MKNRSYWQLIPFIRPQSPTILGAFVCTVIFTIFWPIKAWLAGEVSQYIGQGDPSSIARIAGLTAIVFLLQGIAQYGQDSLMAKAALDVTLSLRKSVYRHLQKLSLNYFEVAKTGDLTYRLTEDIDRIGEVINQFFHDFIPVNVHSAVICDRLFGTISPTLNIRSSLLNN